MFTAPTTRGWTWFTRTSDWRWDLAIDILVERSLWSLIVLAPLVWGGRGDAARFVYATLASISALAWLAHGWITQRSEWRWTPMYFIPLVAIAWVCLQLVPLPPAIIELVTPRHAELLPLWQNETWLAQTGLTAWHCLSLDPTSSQVSLAVLLCYCLVLLVTIVRSTTRNSIQRLIRWMAQASTLMAAFGMLQYFTAGGRFFWVFAHPFRRTDDFVGGSFINENHFASFLIVGATCIVYQLLRLPPVPSRQRRELPHAPRHSWPKSGLTTLGWAASLAVVVLALAMSGSRGAMLAAAVAVAVALTACWRKRLLGGRQIGWSLLVVVLCSTAMAWHNENRFSNSVRELTSGSMEQLDRIGARRAIWSANLHAIADDWFVGAGAGSHAKIYPAYFDRTHPKVFTHAENGYLQIVTELGFVGALLVISIVGLVVRWSLAAWRNCTDREQTAMLAVVLAGISASVVHNLVDFTWFIPATTIQFFILLIVLRRLAIGEENSSKGYAAPPLELTVGVVVAVIAMAVVLTPPALASPAWHDYLAASAADGNRQPQLLRDTAESGNLAELGLSHKLLLRKLAALRRTAKRSPRDAGVHTRLSRTYLQLFDARTPQRENRMSLGQIQSAAYSGGFTSTEEIHEWLDRAIGPDIALLDAARRHARRAIELCPLESLAYVCLSSVAFLDGTDTDALLAQADQLAPHNGSLLFEIGKQYMATGNLEQAIDYWVRCHQEEGAHRLLVVAAMAGRVPATDYLDTFEPDWHTLRIVWQRYLKVASSDELLHLLDYAHQKAIDYSPNPGAVPPAFVWVWLAHMYEEAGDEEQQLICLERAMREDSLLVAVRKNYAIALYRVGDYAKCEPHLRWCLARDSTDSSTRQLLHQAATAKHRQANASRRTPRTITDLR